MKRSIHHRWLKICTLFVSLALASLPVQQASAEIQIMDMTDTGVTAAESTHCMGDSTESMAAADDMNGNCCCESGCSTDCVTSCSQNTSVNGLLLPAAVISASYTGDIITGILRSFSSRIYSPPTPPPLS